MSILLIKEFKEAKASQKCSSKKPFKFLGIASKDQFDYSEILSGKTKQKA